MRVADYYFVLLQDQGGHILFEILYLDGPQLGTMSKVRETCLCGYKPKIMDKEAHISNLDRYGMWDDVGTMMSNGLWTRLHSPEGIECKTCEKALSLLTGVEEPTPTRRLDTAN